MLTSFWYSSIIICLLHLKIALWRFSTENLIQTKNIHHSYCSQKRILVSSLKCWTMYRCTFSGCDCRKWYSFYRIIGGRSSREKRYNRFNGIKFYLIALFVTPIIFRRIPKSFNEEANCVRFFERGCMANRAIYNLTIFYHFS